MHNTYDKEQQEIAENQDQENDEMKKRPKLMPSSPLRDALIKQTKFQPKSIVPYKDVHQKTYYKTIESRINDLRNPITSKDKKILEGQNLNNDSDDDLIKLQDCDVIGGNGKRRIAKTNSILKVRRKEGEEEEETES